MKIKDIIYETPEITEEKLLEIIDNKYPLYRNTALIKRLRELHKEVSINQAFLDEYDLIQDKKSLLTKSQRDFVVGLVGMCMIQMVKGTESKNGGGTETPSNN